MRRCRLAALPCLAIGLVGCPSPGGNASGGATDSASTVPTASTSAAAAPTSTAQAGIPREVIERTLNPKSVTPYAGPSGTLRGTVQVTGDPPPPLHPTLRAGCGAAAATYGKLFRVGQDQRLADVLVTAAGYDAYVTPRKPLEQVTIEECAYSSRTIALTFGQYLRVDNRDRSSYLPVLVGARLPGKLVATPGGSVNLYAPKPGIYQLGDAMGHGHMHADVFVLKYATFDVTGLDGRYEIRDIPVGKVQINALLPAAQMKTVHQEIEIHAGDNELDLTIPFDAATDGPDGGAPPADAAAPRP